MNAKQRELALMIIKQTEVAWKLSVSPVPNHKEVFESIQKYQPGDWVVMWLTLPEDDPRRMGRLILDCTEVINPEDPEDNQVRDRFWYIELVDGRLFRWYNVQPLKVLRFNEPSAEEKAAWVQEAKKRHNLQEE